MRKLCWSMLTIACLFSTTKAYAFTKDCDDIEIRKMFSEGLNNLPALKTKGMQILDLSDGKAGTRIEGKFGCDYFYKDSDGEEGRLEVYVSKNSIGQIIIEFRPTSEPKASR